jgi:hypothetical protein
MMLDGTFEMATILKTGPDGLTRVLVRASWTECESLLVDAREAEFSGVAALDRVSRRGARVHAHLESLSVLSRKLRL